MTQANLKQHIRAWLKEQKIVETDIGSVEVGRILGEGGNALVFETPFAGGTAIKFLAEEVAIPHSSRYTRFLNEYRNLVKLVPSGKIVPLYQYGVCTMNNIRIPYIIMEKCISTLGDIYKQERIDTKKVFAAALEQILASIAIIHSAGIIHRDIKPQNILQRANGDLVLGDFGIAWFDPELYNRLEQTEKNERLANYEFSAPEQVRRSAYDKPTPDMDLYAVGQTLYYCVSGRTIRGPGYTRLRDFSEELTEYEILIDKLVRQIPEDRFQSVQEVIDFLDTQRKKLNDPHHQKMVSFYKQIRAFDEALRKSSPGSYQYRRLTEEKDIDRVMQALTDSCEECDLWWNSYLSHNHACPIKKISDEYWLIEYMECKITEVVIFRNPTPERQYVLLHLAPMPPFGVYEPHDSIKSEEAGLFQGVYVTRGEYDDGYGIIHGEVVELEGVEIRTRDLEEKFLFLSPRHSVIGRFKHSQIRDDIITRFSTTNTIDILDLKPLERLVRASWMSSWD